jgi:hypothetical protein
MQFRNTRINLPVQAPFSMAGYFARAVCIERKELMND